MYQDEWTTMFIAKAAPRLAQIFDGDLNGLPPQLAILLQKLREVECCEVRRAA